MSKSVLSRLETGKREYKEEHLAALAFAYRCEIWELLGRNPLIEPEPIVDLWGKISPKDQEQARRTLQSFIIDKKTA